MVPTIFCALAANCSTERVPGVLFVIALCHNWLVFDKFSINTDSSGGILVAFEVFPGILHEAAIGGGEKLEKTC